MIRIPQLGSAAVLILLAFSSTAQVQGPVIRLNQLGYRTASSNTIAVANYTGDLTVKTVADQEIARFPITPKHDWQMLAGERAENVLLPASLRAGEYTLSLEGADIAREMTAKVSTRPYAMAFPAAVKSYYYQRASHAITPQFGESWSRAAGHPDTAVQFHASSGRAGEGPYASPGGWYDAGDYNKYVVNGAFSVGVMLQLLERHPDVLPDGTLSFPESDNGRNDLLDELKVELDWMLTMQDPADGGLHHKLTTLSFETMVLPKDANSQRFILAKSTAASLDFAGCFALAARVFAKAGESAYAKICLTAAENAYAWAIKNPTEYFSNPADVSTGVYGDDDMADEFAWAATELYLSTRSDKYSSDAFKYRPTVSFLPGANWNSYMANLAAFSLSLHRDALSQGLSDVWQERLDSMNQNIVRVATALKEHSKSTPYNCPISGWHWGSSSDIMGAAIFALEAYRITNDPSFLDAAESWTHIVFGYNPTGYSWVTGFGDRTPLNIHHRPSAADGVREPVPGFLIGGPNESQQDAKDGVAYPVERGEYPMRSYVDVEGSYASNEVCINWNAPLVYVLGVLDKFHARAED